MMLFLLNVGKKNAVRYLPSSSCTRLFAPRKRKK
uniref:Uncharacterized protein n=1 Tax=Anguilla anguilla TaxID=7936 RepID=A0A0E9VCF9_ANGAN